MNWERIAKERQARIDAALAACDAADRYDPDHGHWISTNEVRAHLTTESTPSREAGKP